MITDLQSIEAPLAKATVWGKIKMYQTNLHKLRLGSEWIGLLVRSDNCLLAIFAESYSAELAKYIDRMNFRWCAYGSKRLEGILNVGYCRVIDNCGKFEQELCTDVSACCVLKKELEKLFNPHSIKPESEGAA